MTARNAFIASPRLCSGYTTLIFLGPQDSQSRAGVTKKACSAGGGGKLQAYLLAGATAGVGNCECHLARRNLGLTLVVSV